MVSWLARLFGQSHFDSAMPYHVCMATELAERENALKDTALLISGRQAARLLGIDRATFQGVATANNLQPVSTGKSTLWRRLEIEALVGLRESA
jgi:predicted DNA-binding transcriptional regulator AlpA